MPKKTQKSPFKNHSIEDVLEAENGTFYIQIGHGMFESDTGKLAFSKERAEHFYMAVWEGLNDMRKNGDIEERADAMICLLNFRIIPLRFH